MANTERQKTRRMNFTKRSLDAIKVPDERITIFDTDARGLFLAVYPTGARSFFHVRSVRGRPHRTYLGRTDELTIAEARHEAGEINRKAAKWRIEKYRGPSPLEKKSARTFGELIDVYISKRILGHSAHPDEAAKSVRRIEKYLPKDWRDREASSITRADVSDLHMFIGKENGPRMANRVVQTIRAVYNFADIEAIFVGKNPAEKIQIFHEPQRSRYLQPAELPAFFRALKLEPSRDLADYVKLALWTGARRSDVLGMRWTDLELDDNKWSIPSPKNRIPYVVPLTPEAIGILRERVGRRNGSEFVFPGAGKGGHLVDLKRGWKRLLERAGITGLTQHDLRRTLGSFQTMAGTPLQVVGKSLGQTSLEATQIYARLDLAAVRKSVLAATRTILAAAESKKALPARNE